MKKYTNLTINGTALDKEQLLKHLEKIASDQILKDKSDKITYPIFGVIENFEYITEVYNLLMQNLKEGITIHPAGEWLLDNYYIIEKTVKIVKKDLNMNRYVNFLGIANGSYKGFARIFVLCAEIVSYTDGKITKDNLIELLKAYQNNKSLSMQEFWSMRTFLQISLIEKISKICETIYIVQMQKYKVENIIERLVDGKNKSNYKNIAGYKMKNSFIEYMSYRLKSYGRKAYSYLNILEEEVNKMGMTVLEVVSKEHYDIALKKVSMGNSINSMNNLLRLDFMEIFEQINCVEEILRKDPARVYSNMDYETKVYYRNKIEELSKKTKISEIYIAKKCLELANKREVGTRESHVGYYLISEGINELLKNIGKAKEVKSNKYKVKLYIAFINLMTLFLTVLIVINFKSSIQNNYLSLILGFLLVISINYAINQIVQYGLNKIIKPKLIPKMDFLEGIPKEYTSMVVIPTIVKNKQKVEEIFRKLEVFYMANKSDNLYFTLLGDSSSGNKEKEEFDDEIINEGFKIIERLNKKHGENKFNFIYRKRVWNASEECYLGWERKRGMLNQFNQFLLKEIDDPFKANSFLSNNHTIPIIKYIITLDSDTNLVLNSGIKLIGAMAHILNKPSIDKEKNIVVNGYGIMQPRINISILDSRKSWFTKIYAGNGGIDPYSNAISNVYQDNFEEGIFTGKGIYDLKVFNTVLKDQIPENTVLSHDLLEGCYLKCGLVTDIVLLDTYPTSYAAFVTRQNRWIRGDWQILSWIFDKTKMNLLSKYKITDNLLRSLIEIFCLIGIFIYNKNFKISLLFLVILIIPQIIETFDKIICKKDGQKFQKRFSNTITGIRASFVRLVINVGVLPDKAYNAVCAISKTIYRMTISKKHLLEWITAEEAEKVLKKDIKSYYKNMWFNFFIGIVSLFFIKYNLFFLVGILWIIAPAIMCIISKNIKEEVVKKVNKSEEIYLKEIGKKTWKYFKETLNEQNNFLPPDNYQEDRIDKLALKTSPTNIGLAMVAVISSYDLGYENLLDTVQLLRNMVNTVEKLVKWNGHLYNWYNIESLNELNPRYISVVDSGNFIGYLYIVKQFYINNNSDEVYKIEKLINEADFSKLYNSQMGLFPIGFDVDENKYTEAYYDLLASEARQASLIAIAKREAPEKHWYNLGRTLTILNNHKGLISWSGTAFEYLMPNINIPIYPTSLLDESCKMMVMCQELYAKKLGIPWGFSEAAYNLKDLDNNYQYKAFGIPWLGLKRGLADEMVVSSYGTILALNEQPKEVLKNLKILEEQGMRGKYGFYESIDFTPNRVKKGNQSEVVKTYMAHHQGLIIASINNFLNNNILQKRFIENVEIQAVDVLLQEKMIESIIISKEKKEKIEKIKYKDYENYCEKVYKKLNENERLINVISNNEYTIVIDSNGEGYSKYKDVYINRFKQTSQLLQGIFFYIKNIKSGNVFEKPDKYMVTFSPDKSKIIRVDENIETKISTIIVPNMPAEIRKVEITNLGNQNVILEVSSVFEPVLSQIETDYSHMAFNNLFLLYEYIEESNILLVRRKDRTKNGKDIYMAVNLYTESDIIGDYEYEISKERLFGRCNFGVPELIKNSKPFSKKISLIIDPIIGLRRSIKVLPGKKIELNLIISISEDREKAINQVRSLQKQENIEKAFNLSRARMEAEINYLGIDVDNIETYQKMLASLLFEKEISNKIANMKKTYSVSELWKYGISGDLPILLVIIKSINDIGVIKQVIEAYEFFRVKNIKVDLVIINEEKQSYENFVKEGINEVILNKNIGFLLNIKGGIFILNNVKDKEIFEIFANLEIDASLGNIKVQMEEVLISKNKKYLFEENKDKEKKFESVNDNIKYFNEYGGFINEGKEYLISRTHRLPTVWSHIIANENFGTVVTDSFGGYTWYKNSKLNKISQWSNNTIEDTSSEMIWMQDEETNEKWSLRDSDKVIYGFGYAKYFNNFIDFEQEVEIFIPKEDNIKVNLIHLKNMLPKKRKIKFGYYINLVLGEDEIKTKKFLNIEFSKTNNVIYAKNMVNDNYPETLYVSCSEKIKNLSENGRVIFEFEIDLEAYETKDISIVFGSDVDIMSCKDIAYKYSNINNCNQEYKKVKKYWEETLSNVQVKTPVESINILLNGWLIYQTVCSRLWGRTGFYQSGGAYGFRDQLQDVISLKYIDLNIMKNQIIRHSKHQFIEGDVEHWWHEETLRGIRTRFSDDLLWLPFLVSEYINFSSDYSILDIETNYKEGKILDDGIDERYDRYEVSEQKDSIYEHCKKAIDKALNFGENGLPKIGSGDWNDGFSNVGNKCKGESVWLGFFLYEVLKRFIEIKNYKGESVEIYEKIMKDLKISLNTNGWDGRWFKRAFMDDRNGTTEVLRMKNVGLIVFHKHGV